MRLLAIGKRTCTAPIRKQAAAASQLTLVLFSLTFAASPLGPARFSRGSEPVATAAGRQHSLAETSLAVPGRLEVRPMAVEGPTWGLDPRVVKAAYSLSTSALAGEGTTIAIVTAYHNPTAESDLAVFSRQFGLPECTVANGCFTQVSPQGTGTAASMPTEWMQESALDTQWAHAIAPGSKILLVEALAGEWDGMLAAVDYAKVHARYVAMSWSVPEFSAEAAFDAHFEQAGVSFFASSGDLSGSVRYPSASPHVVSVGGTVLNTAAGEFLSEFRWPRTGWGCSAYEHATAAQLNSRDHSDSGCGESRATPDLSLVAEPGVSIYWNGTWLAGGGTSAATIIVAARAAVSGSIVDANTVYGSSMSFRPVTSGAGVRNAALDPATGRGSWVGPIVTPDRVTVTTDGASRHN